MGIEVTLNFVDLEKLTKLVEDLNLIYETRVRIPSGPQSP
jgi:hypothetical protein